MQERTYETLPSDVLSSLPRESVRLDLTIPKGEVDVYSQTGVTRMPVNAFVRARRKIRKVERRNRKANQ